MGSVGKEIERAYDKVEGAVSDGWEKSGLSSAWHNVSQAPKDLLESVAGKFTPDIPEPETQAPGAGVQTDQQSMQSDSLANERRRRAVRYSMSDTNRTGNAQMRSGSLKSTLG